MQLNVKNNKQSVRVVMPASCSITYREPICETHFSIRSFLATRSDIKISFLLLVLIFFTACNPSEKTEKQSTEKEKQVVDSISKVKQKAKVDSLKKTNPLLIMPPDSNFTGDYIDKYPTGITKFKGFYRFGKRHGQWISFYQNGLPWSEMNFDKGLRHGPNITYTESGKIRYQGMYKNDKRDSVWTYFDSIGNVAERLLYKNDIIEKKLPLK